MPRQMELFTNSARLVLKSTDETAREFKTSKIMPVHMLLAMTRVVDTDAYLALDDYDIIETKLLPFVKLKRPPHDTNPETIELSDAVKHILEVSVVSARKHGQFWVGTAHLLLAILDYEDDQLIADILAHFGAQREQLYLRTREYLGDYASQEQKATEYRQLVLQQMQSADEPTAVSKLISRIFGLIGKRKNDEK